MISLTSKEKMLCCALADDPTWQSSELGRWWRETGEQQAWEFCGQNEARSIVASALVSSQTGVSPPERWQQESRQTGARLRLYMEQLDRVAGALARENIRLVALKNSGIARGIYPELAACPMGDIDVLVSPGDFRRAHEVMGRLGFQMGDRSPFELTDIEEAEKHGGAEYIIPLADGSTLWFELQWRAVAGRWIRPDQEPPADDLLARSVAIPGTDARLLAPEDNLLQVCLHTAKHSYVRAPGFRLHTDVDRIVRRCVVDWDAFAARVEKIGVRTAVYLALRIPADLLGTPVPAGVLKRLDFAPRKHLLMMRWLQRVGIFNPQERKWSKPGYIGFNLLLYDTWGGIWLAVFPDYEWMRARYAVKSRWALPWGYAKRAVDLLFKRANT